MRGPDHLLRRAKNTKSHSVSQVTFSDSIHLLNIYLACPAVSLVPQPDVPALIGRKFLAARLKTSNLILVSKPAGD